MSAVLGVDKQKDLTVEYPGGEFEFDKRTHLMGILNVTPDSFSDGGRYHSVDAAVEHGLRMADEGADVIDVGGESTRPGALPVPGEEELRRVIPVIEGLAARLTIPISIDTYKSSVARRAIASGARMINDVSALRFDPEMAGVAADCRVPVVLMHMRGQPATMQKDVVYDSLIDEILDFLKERIKEAQRAGIHPRRIMVDPGIGFGKTVIDGNLMIIKHLSLFRSLGRPILVGPSRKAFIGQILGDGASRDEGTAVLGAAAILNGANMLRVHDVKRMKTAATLIDAMKGVR